MSNVSSIGSTSVDPLQFLRQMTEANSTSSSNRASQANGGEPPQQLWVDIEDSAEVAGLSAQDIEALRTEMKDAISTAMESVDLSGDPAAGHDAIDDAIIATLQEHGIDTEELESKMSAAKSRMQEMGPPPGGRPSGPPPGQGSSSGGSSIESTLISSITDLSSYSDTDEASSLLSSLFPLVDEEA